MEQLPANHADCRVSIESQLRQWQAHHWHLVPMLVVQAVPKAKKALPSASGYQLRLRAAVRACQTRPVLHALPV